jgi:hypothetical protein
MVRAREVAAQLADGPPLVYACIKEIARETMHLPVHEAFHMVTKRKLKSVDVLYSSDRPVGGGAGLRREAQASVEGQVTPASPGKEKMAASLWDCGHFSKAGSGPPDVCNRSVAAEARIQRHFNIGLLKHALGIGIRGEGGAEGLGGAGEEGVHGS